jgi:nucleoside 2-deoxyribosyltransferase
MRVYTAGAFGDAAKVAREAAVLAADGHEITSTWTDRETRAAACAELAGRGEVPCTDPEDPPGVHNNNSPEQDGRNGLVDILEVTGSEALVADVSLRDYAYRGTSAEVGAALALGLRVICVWEGRSAVPAGDGSWRYSHAIMQSPFFWHPAIEHCNTWDEARAILRRAGTSPVPAESE